MASATLLNRCSSYYRELATQLSLDHQFTRRAVPGNGRRAGAGATGVQLHFGAPVAYLALYAAGVFVLRSLCVERSDPQVALVLLSLVRTMRLPSYKLTL